MGWSLWIDDQICDMNTPGRWTPVAEGWNGAPDVETAKWLVEKYGMPVVIDFDHDLGRDEDGNVMDVRPFILWLIDRSYEYDGGLLPPPSWKIHSENPVGRQWIDATMESWAKNALQIKNRCKECDYPPVASADYSTTSLANKRCNKCGHRRWE